MPIFAQKVLFFGFFDQKCPFFEHFFGVRMDGRFFMI